jgi:hypothetical protein
MNRVPEEPMSRIDEIKARCEAATPGPWTFVANPAARHAHIYGPDNFKIHDFFNGTVDLAEGNAEFIAHAREDVEYLTARLAVLRDENESLRDVLKHTQDERLILAKLCADEPQFFNPLEVFAAKKIRDLAIARAALVGEEQ